MVAFEVVGYKSGEFNDRKSGEKIAYGKLYVTSESSDVVGLSCEALSVKPEMLDGIQVGDQVHVVYNRYGKVDGLAVI